jgi:hypothetical protein
MAAPRTQAHQKRVQNIVEEAADKIAQSSPIEEEVVVTVEELPTDGKGARSSVAEKTQQATEEAANAWFDVAQNAFDPFRVVSTWNPRTLVESSFRFYEELLAVQKDFALKLANAISVRD